MPITLLSFALSLIKLIFEEQFILTLNIQVEFSPTLKKLASMMDNIAVQLTSCLSIFQRLPDLLTKKRSTKEVITFGP